MPTIHRTDGLPQLFVDMDGVVADFDGHHEAIFGFRPNKQKEEEPYTVNWDKVRAYPDGFYRTMPPFPALDLFWGVIAHLDPILLTGIPSSVPEAADNKREWVRKHLGRGVGVICCLSKEKCNYAKPGDILIDDWEKYKQLWVAKGGVWITHNSFGETLDELGRLGLFDRSK